MQIDKSAHRKAANARRAQAHEATGMEAARVACDAVQPCLRAAFGADLHLVTLAGYMPMRSEISPLRAMGAHPGPVCVPVIVAPHTPLAFHRWSPDASMMRGKFGADIPATADPLTPVALIVPLLAFDARGYRLGYGGGFYDRTLAQLRAQHEVLAIGLAYAAQEQAEVPTELTDEPLDAIVTEAGVTTCARDTR